MANKRVHKIAAVNQLQTGQWPCVLTTYRNVALLQPTQFSMNVPIIRPSTTQLTHVTWCMSTNTNSIQSAITAQRMASKQADLKPCNNCRAIPQCKRRLRLHCFFQQLMSAHTRTDSCSNTDTHAHRHTQTTAATLSLNTCSDSQAC